uniref:Uncharacterized protein n=1 Tax=Odontella aurita TaxID=265563 RepID=A0A7S4J0Z1_9STRA|mmetsp:Transcript_34986/g.104350  ORF Transcript_34986/g.104350 Transcript_34986/m.104350 type:complete len:200 (+) Transcript_34986:517-1116(+)
MDAKNMFRMQLNQVSLKTVPLHLLQIHPLDGLNCIIMGFRAEVLTLSSMRSSSKFCVEACSMILSGVVTTILSAVVDVDEEDGRDEKPMPKPARCVALSPIAFDANLNGPAPFSVSLGHRLFLRQLPEKPKGAPSREEDLRIPRLAMTLRKSGLRLAAPDVGGNILSETPLDLPTNSFVKADPKEASSRPNGRWANAVC